MRSDHREGLDWIFLPFDLGALAAAIPLTIRTGVRGIAAAPVFIGCWLGSFLALLLAFYLGTFLYSLTLDTQRPVTGCHPGYRAVVTYAIGQLCRYGRVRIHCTGREKLPAGRFLFVSNHRSGYDPIVTVWALRKTPTAFIAKPEILRIPMVGPMIRMANYQSIDRENPRAAMTTINASAALLKNDVVSVGIYPEGTRSRDGSQLPYHSGVFKIAQKASVPLVVATVTGTEHIMKNTPWRHTDVYLRICEVIPPEELKGSCTAVSERVREIIEADIAGRTAVLT